MNPEIRSKLSISFQVPLPPSTLRSGIMGEAATVERPAPWHNGGQSAMQSHRTFSCSHPHRQGRNHCWDCEVAARRRSPEEYAATFWAKVEKSAECWVWRGHLTPQGYGQTTYRGRTKTAHHVAWFLTYGAWPKMLRHHCDNPPCVSPVHLAEGTQADNIRDKVARDRQAKGSRVGRAKITEAEALAIRTWRAEGGLLREIGTVFGLSESSVSALCCQKTWRHV